MSLIISFWADSLAYLIMWAEVDLWFIRFVLIVMLLTFHITLRNQILLVWGHSKHAPAQLLSVRTGVLLLTKQLVFVDFCSGDNAYSSYVEYFWNAYDDLQWEVGY